MNRISAALVGINQSTADMVAASKSLAAHTADLVHALRDRETLLVTMAQRYPDLRVEDIIAVCNNAESQR
jgi:hypothetical protein